MGYGVGIKPVRALLPMNSPDPIVYLQLPVIRQIVTDETYLEAERRGCDVFSDDRVVRENVCRVVLRIGAELRAASQRALDTAPLMISRPHLPEAA